MNNYNRRYKVTDKSQIEYQKKRLNEDSKKTDVITYIAFGCFAAMGVGIVLYCVGSGTDNDFLHSIGIALGIIGCLIGSILALVARVQNDKAFNSGQELKMAQADAELEFSDSIAYQYEEVLANCGINNEMHFDGYLLWVNYGNMYIINDWQYYEKKIGQEYRAHNHKETAVLNKEGYYNFNYSEIPIKNIKYFTKEGDIQYTTHVSGGGGGGTSIGGAIVGGLIAGEVGAIIGSRKPVQGISSRVEEHDTRKTIIKYYAGQRMVSESYSIGMFEVFEELIPEKEYNVVVANNGGQIANRSLIGGSAPKRVENDSIRRRIDNHNNL